MPGRALDMTRCPISVTGSPLNIAGNEMAVVRFKSNGKIIRNVDVLPLSRAIDVVLTELK